MNKGDQKALAKITLIPLPQKYPLSQKYKSYDFIYYSRNLVRGKTAFTELIYSLRNVSNP